MAITNCLALVKAVLGRSNLDFDASDTSGFLYESLLSAINLTISKIRASQTLYDYRQNDLPLGAWNEKQSYYPLPLPLDVYDYVKDSVSSGTTSIFYYRYVNPAEFRPVYQVDCYTDVYNDEAVRELRFSKLSGGNNDIRLVYFKNNPIVLKKDNPIVITRYSTIPSIDLLVNNSLTIEYPENILLTGAYAYFRNDVDSSVPPDVKAKAITDFEQSLVADSNRAKVKLIGRGGARDGVADLFKYGAPLSVGWGWKGQVP